MGELPENTRGAIGRNISAQKKGAIANEPDWALKLEKWGTQKEIEELEYAHKKKHHTSRNSKKRT